jgi:penicillin-binding protein 2
MSAYVGDGPGVGPSRLRFLVFGLAVIIGAGALSARLFALQVAGGTTQYTTFAATNRNVLELIPSTRGTVFDRKGRPLVTNVASYSVRVRPLDLPESRRDEVVQTLGVLLDMDATEINIAIDSNPGSRYDTVRIAQDVDPVVAGFIAEASADLPGVQVVVETQRTYAHADLFSHILGYTGPISGEEYADMRELGYLPDDPIGRAGVEATYEEQLRGTYGLQLVETDPSGRRIQVVSTERQPVAGSSLRLTIDTKVQEEAEKALHWGMKAANLKRAVIIVMNPQNGEILAMVSEPTYDNNLFSGGIDQAAYKKLLNDPQKPLVNHAISDIYPPGSTYKVVAGTGVLADGKITPHTQIRTAAYLTLGGFRFRDWNGAGFGMCNIYCGFGHSSDTFFYQAAAMLGIDRLGYWAKQYGFGRQSGIDLPNEASGIVPTNQWKIDEYGLPIYPGEVYLAGIGQGYDAVTPLQLLNAYATLANGGSRYRPHVVKEIIGPDGTVTEVEPDVVLEHDAPNSAMRVMRHAARNVPVIHHTYNLVDLPIIVAGKTGTAEFGAAGPNGDYPFHNWFVSFVPKNPYKQPGDPYGFKAIEKGDSELAVVVFSYNAGTLGNTSTEISKYFYQLHFGIKKDYRLPYLMDRGPYYRAPE